MVVGGFSDLERTAVAERSGVYSERGSFAFVFLRISWRRVHTSPLIGSVILSIWYLFSQHGVPFKDFPVTFPYLLAALPRASGFVWMPNSLHFWRSLRSEMGQNFETSSCSSRIARLVRPRGSVSSYSSNHL